MTLRLWETILSSLMNLNSKHHVWRKPALLITCREPDDPTVAVRISGCLADISAWMKEHHLQINLAKTELLVFSATPTLQHDFTIQINSSTTTPSSSVRNLGVIFDDQLTFKDHIAKSSRRLRSASKQRLMVTSQRGTKSHSRMFSFTVPGWWNEHPTPIRNAEFLKVTPENSSLPYSLDFCFFFIKNKKKSPLLSFLNLSLSSLFLLWTMPEMLYYNYKHFLWLFASL